MEDPQPRYATSQEYLAAKQMGEGITEIEKLFHEQEDIIATLQATKRAMLRQIETLNNQLEAANLDNKTWSDISEKQQQKIVELEQQLKADAVKHFEAANERVRAVTAPLAEQYDEELQRRITAEQRGTELRQVALQAIGVAEDLGAADEVDELYEALHMSKDEWRDVFRDVGGYAMEPDRVKQLEAGLREIIREWDERGDGRVTRAVEDKARALVKDD